MPAGRRPTPTHLKVVKGNPGRRPLSPKEPRPERGLPPMPAGLSDEAAAAWGRIGPALDRMGVLTRADGVALELFCEAYADWLTARETVQEEGATYEGQTQFGTIIRAHPAVAQRADAHRRLESMLREFGLTPASRSKVEREHGEEADPVERYFG